MEEEKKEILWTTKEFVYREKSVDWYWYFGLLVIILISVALYLSNIMFAFIIAIGAFILLIFATKKPRDIDYRIDKKGISFDGQFYDNRDILSFCIVNDKKKCTEKILLLQLKKATALLIIIPLSEDLNLDELHTFLLNSIEEKEIAVPFSFILMDIVGY